MDLRQSAIRTDSEAIRVVLVTQVKILREALAETLRQSPTPCLVDAVPVIDDQAFGQFLTAPDIVLLNLADRDWLQSARTALRTFPWHETRGDRSRQERGAT